MAKTFSGPAIVANGSLPGSQWAMEELTTSPDLQDHEVVVQMVASGICHTDLVISSIPEGQPLGIYPRVLGHEGSGYVAAVGSGVRSVAVGDPVLLSYTSCGDCGMCNDANAAYCDRFGELNFGGRHTYTNKAGAPVLGSFFGQSSFGSYSIARESSLVNVKDLVKNKDDLALYAPLGCGIQTGAGTVVNTAKPTEKDIVLITGLGGVGLSAIMGAAVCKPKMVVALDRIESRLELAKELGATHTLNSDKLGGKTLPEAIKELCGGAGPHIIIECSGAPPLIDAAMEGLRNCGTMYQVGAAPPTYEFKVVPFNWILTGKTYRGVIEGESHPPDFVPKMIGWHREGKFPVDRLIKYTKAAEFEKALEDMHSGKTVKPVLVW